MAKAKSAAASTVVQPCAAAAPIYDPVYGEVIDSLTGGCQSVWGESELWDDTDIACLGAMSDVSKRRDADSELPQGSGDVQWPDGIAGDADLCLPRGQHACQRSRDAKASTRNSRCEYLGTHSDQFRNVREG